MKRLWRWIDGIRYQGSLHKRIYGRHLYCIDTNHSFNETHERYMSLIISSLIQLNIEHCASIVLQNGLKHELPIQTQQRTMVVEVYTPKAFVKTSEFRDQSINMGSIFAKVVKVVQVFIQTGAVHYPTRLACCDSMGFCSNCFPCISPP